MNGVVDHEDKVYVVFRKAEKPFNVFGEVAYKLVSSVYFVRYYEKGYDVLVEFQNHKEVKAVGVVDEKMRPIGVLIRNDFFATMSKPFVLDMYKYKGIGSLVKEVKLYPYYLHILSLADDLEESILSKKEEFFVLVDEEGKFLGVFSTHDLFVYLYRMTKRDLLAAREVQRNIVPEDHVYKSGGYVVFAGSRQAKDLGGDFYFFKDFGDKIVFSLCDVSGKGPSASLITTTLGGFFNSFDFANRDPEDFISSINRYIYRLFGGEKYFTGAIGEVYKDSGKCRVWDMGHGYIIIKSGKEINKLDTDRSNGPVGIAEDIDLKKHEFYINNKDMLIAFSDGFVEQRNEKGEFYPEKRFYSIVKGSNDPKLIKDALLTDIRSFRGKYPQGDDMSILIIQRDIDVMNEFS